MKVIATKLPQLIKIKEKDTVIILEMNDEELRKKKLWSLNFVKDVMNFGAWIVDCQILIDYS